MSASKQALRRRMNSVQNTQKITNAMQMLAVNKYAYNMNRLETHLEHSKFIKGVLQRILWQLDETEGVYLHQNDVERSAIIIFTSDMGLCGAYNQNVLQKTIDIASEDDVLVVIGKRGHSWLKERGMNVVNEMIKIEEISENQLKRITDMATRAFIDNQVKSVKLVYSKYINPLSNEPTVLTLLPLSRDESYNDDQRELIFEPNEAVALEYLVPLYLDTVIMGYKLESMVCEHSARRMSMDKAVDNAEELLDSLRNTYHKDRQAKITQEITEIVSGANLRKDGVL